MSKKIKLLKERLLGDKIVILDGALGTEILHRGVPTTLPLWSAQALLTHPEVVREIHEDYIKAGAEIIITDTFRTTKRQFGKKGITGKAKKATILACKLAKEAITNIKAKFPVFIAGSVAPLEDCYSPNLTPKDKDLKKEHLEYAKNLKLGGVDFILLETMITLQEIYYALEAAKIVKLPVAVSFCINEKAKLLSGESLEDGVKLAEKYKPLFIGINCVSPEIATLGLKQLLKLTKKPIAVYAQGDGNPEVNQGWQFAKEDRKNNYLKEVKKWQKLGAHIIGGCCGTTPLYINEISKSINKYGKPK